jgi:hypothetical protein
MGVSRTKKWHLMYHHASQSARRRFGVRRREAVLCEFTLHPSERLHMGSPLHRERASKASPLGVQAVPGAQRAGSTSWYISPRTACTVLRLSKRASSAHSQLVEHPVKGVWASLEIRQCSPGMAGTMPVSSSFFPVNNCNGLNNPP